MNSSILIKRDRKDNDSNSSNDDDDKTQPGEFLVRATKFIGVIVGKGWGSDTTKVDNEVNERYQEATDNNLYRGLRNVRHTDSYHEDFGLEDEGSLSDDSDFAMPQIGEVDFEEEDSVDSNDFVGSRYKDNERGDAAEEDVSVDLLQMENKAPIRN